MRDAQDEDLLKVMDLSQSRSVEAPPSLQQASRKRMQAAKESIGLKARAGHQTSAAAELLNAFRADLARACHAWQGVATESDLLHDERVAVKVDVYCSLSGNG